MNNRLFEELGITPGQWGLPHFAISDCKCKCGYIFGKDDPECKTIAEVFYHDENDAYNEHHSIDKSIANARVICSAPKMLTNEIENSIDARKILQCLDDHDLKSVRHYALIIAGRSAVVVEEATGRKGEELQSLTEEETT